MEASRTLIWNDLSVNIVFRCDGSNVMGLGHVVRCVALALYFRENGWTVDFITKHQGPYLLGYKYIDNLIKACNRLIGQRQPGSIKRWSKISI